MRLLAVLDTNVLVSALLEPRGLPARLLDQAVDGAFLLALSDYILGELDDVLGRLGEVEPATRRDARRLLDRVSRRVRPLSGSWSPRDAKDNPVVGTAVAAMADYLVTGDRPLLDLGPVSGVEIVSVRKFHRILARRAGGKTLNRHSR